MYDSTYGKFADFYSGKSPKVKYEKQEESEIEKNKREAKELEEKINKMVEKEYHSNSKNDANQKYNEERMKRIGEVEKIVNESREKEQNTSQPAEIKDTDDNTDSNEDLNNRHLDEDELADLYDAESVKNKVTQIRKWYNDTQNNLGSFRCETQEGVSYYYDNNDDLVKILVKKGYDGWDKSREYYFHNDELYFAFVYKYRKEERLYYHNGYFIRYIGTDGVVHDYGDIGTTGEDTSNSVLSEGNDLFTEG